MRTALLSLVAGIVVLAGIQPAIAASTPPQVGLVSFTDASLSGSKATLTLSWPAAKNAKTYEIFMADNYEMSGDTSSTTTGTTKTITGLKPGADYFFQIRGLNGSKKGTKSQRSGHGTIRAQGASSGSTYDVMTYNVCSAKCSGWSTREAAALERVTTLQPDVVAAQEAAELSTPTGYTEAESKSAKKLFFKTSRFTEKRADYVSMGNGRYAVWAELLDKQTSKKMIFVDVHTSTGGDEPDAVLRRGETMVLVREMAEVNTSDLPIVYAGDFNSHKNRTNDYVADVLNDAGYYDAFDLAMTLSRQHYNSFGDFLTTPKVGVKWGDHVDHVFVTPGTTRILSWANVGKLDGAKYASPVPSDHNPLLIEVQVN